MFWIKLFFFSFSKCINYEEFADKFPENDLIWSHKQDMPSASYLVKFWVDLNFVLDDIGTVSSMYAVTNMYVC
jgi:hypothetical protein